MIAFEGERRPDQPGERLVGVQPGGPAAAEDDDYLPGEFAGLIEFFGARKQPRLVPTHDHSSAAGGPREAACKRVLV